MQSERKAEFNRGYGMNETQVGVKTGVGSKGTHESQGGTVALETDKQVARNGLCGCTSRDPDQPNQS